MKKKIIVIAVLFLLIAVGITGYQFHQHAEAKKQQEIEALAKKEAEEKAEADRIAREVAEKEAQKKRDEYIKAELEKAKQKAQVEKAKQEALKKEEAKEVAEKKKETVQVEEPKTKPKEVAPVTVTTGKQNVTKQAKVVEQKKPETKVVPKKENTTPPADIVEKAKEDKATPSGNTSSPFATIKVEYSEVPPVYDSTTMTDSSKFSDAIPGTGDKF